MKLLSGGNGNEVSRSIDLACRLPEAFRAVEGARRLIKRINRTNSVTLFEGERTVSDVLAERDVLAMRRKLYAGLAEAATVQQNRYMRTEVKYVSTLNVAENQKRADALAREYRELDARIQALNWDTELM